jgi:hypothetical protein
MKRWLPIGLLILLALGGIWFWFLGALPKEAVPTATIARVDGRVVIQNIDGSELPAQVGMTIEEGMMVIAGLDGNASLDWCGEGETELAPSSELVVRTMTCSYQGPLVLRLRLEFGRAWTRVSRLLELEDDVAVETSDVVATVRGTSFDVEKHPGEATVVRVADSVVEASGAIVTGYPDGFFIPENAAAEFAQGARPSEARFMTDEERATAWFIDNNDADKRFRENVRARMSDSLAVDRSVKEGTFSFLRDWSEGLRIRVASGTDRERLKNRYALRNLMTILRLAQEGKSGLAYREFARMDGEMKTRLSAGDPERDIQKVMASAQRVFQDVDPASPAYRIKQRIEEWLISAASDSTVRVYARLLAIDARLDETKREMEAGHRDSAPQILVLARQGLSNVDRERRTAVGEMEKDRAEKLRSIWSALSARADALDEKLSLMENPPAPVVTEPVDVEPTSTEPAIPVVTSTEPAIPVATTTIPIVAQVKLVSMTLSPGDSTIGFNERVTYRAIAVYDDGQTRDVTKSARFTMSPTGYGALNDNVFSAMVLQGTIVVTAEYQEADVSVKAGSALTIVDRTQ